MTIATNSMLMRAYTDEAASCGDQRVADMIVERARDFGLAGATVLRGRSGFGSGSELHSHHLFGISDNAPLVIEIVDEEGKLRGFVEQLADLRDIGLITLERVEVLSRRSAWPVTEGDAK